MELPPTIRAFVALRLSPETDRALVALIDELRAPGDGINWARPSNLHLTLRFLGAAVNSVLIPPLVEHLTAVARATAPFVVVAHGIGVFPNFFRPRVIWAGLKGEALMALAARVEEAAVRVGFEAEPRPFAPHLTLGRVRNLRRFRRLRPKLEAAAERDFGSSRIESMTLYQSRLSPTGSEYFELASFRFEQPS